MIHMFAHDSAADAADQPPLGANVAYRVVKPLVGDDVLVLRTQDGDPQAFEQLVRRYQQPMYAVAVRLLGDPDEAEDATQNAFIAAWRRLPEFRLDSKFSTWLYRIVTNHALNQVRSRNRNAQPADNDTLDAPTAVWNSTSAATDPAQQAQRTALIAAVQAALAALPTQLRLCWLLREIHERTYQEVADITNVSLDTARGRIFRARQRLAEAMASWR